MKSRLAAMSLVFLALGCERRAPTRGVVGVAQTWPAPSERVRFVAVGDTGDGKEGQALVAAAIGRTCATRGCDFVVLLGDLVYPSGPTSPDDPAIAAFLERPYAAIERPFYAVLGNHDEGGDGAGWEPARGDALLAYAERHPWLRMPARHWRLSTDVVDLVGLDTNGAMFGRDGEQLATVRGWLDASRAPFRVVVGHHPYRSSGVHGDAGAYDKLPSFTPVAAGSGVKQLVQGAVCGRAELYVAGHDHHREWLVATCDGTELAVSGAGAEGHPVKQGPASRFASSALGYLYVDVTATRLTAELHDASGKVDFARTLERRGR